MVIIPWRNRGASGPWRDIRRRVVSLAAPDGGGAGGGADGGVGGRLLESGVEVEVELVVANPRRP